MPTLNELQKRQVIKLEPTKSADYMLVCIQKYDNLSLDDFPNMQPAKRAHIQERLNSMPNPNEQEEWGRLASMLNTPSQELLHALESYIQHWESTPPCGNHLDEARQMVSSVRDALQREQADKEQNEWVNVDVLSKDSLIAYLRKYPNTIHKNEIDDCFWPLVDMENVQEIQTYLDAFPQGGHVSEARELLNAIVEWDNGLLLWYPLYGQDLCADGFVSFRLSSYQFGFGWWRLCLGTPAVHRRGNNGAPNARLLCHDAGSHDLPLGSAEYRLQGEFGRNVGRGVCFWYSKQSRPYLHLRGNG